MEQLTQHLPTDRSSPRLWFERLVIFSEPDEAHVLRTVPFHRGLNLVWAKEPEAGRAKGTQAAGHGVGKTSLCLLLRFCLGEPSDAVAELRAELFSEFAQGGVVAVLHVEGHPRWALPLRPAGQARVGLPRSSTWCVGGKTGHAAWSQRQPAS